MLERALEDAQNGRHWVRTNEDLLILKSAKEVIHTPTDQVLFRGEGEHNLYTPFLVFDRHLIYHIENDQLKQTVSQAVVNTEEPVFFRDRDESLEHSVPFDQIGGDIDPFNIKTFEEYLELVGCCLLMLALLL